jgi:hypothetical protein
MRVNMSAMGSVVVIPSPSTSPASLDHAGDFSRQRKLPETNPAQLEFANESARTAAAEAAIPVPALQLRFLIRLSGGEPFVSSDLCSCCH